MIIKMKNVKVIKYIAASVIMAAILSMSVAVYAAAPTLTLTSASGDSVKIEITGNPNASVMLYYNVATTNGLRTQSLGTTNADGKLSTTVSTAGYNAVPGSWSYVIINNEQSAMVVWPYTTNSAPTLSQTSLTLPIGQTSYVSASNTTFPIYIASNSNPSVASLGINGAQITITALNPGLTNVNVCYQNNATNCATMTINVQSTNSQYLTFSQSSLTLNPGQTSSVIVSGGSGSYFMSGNSNPSIVQASLNNSVVNLQAYSTNGISNVTICSANTNICGSINVTVGSGIPGSAVTFSQNNVFINSGMSQVVTLYGSGPFYVSSNSNPNALSTSIKNNELTVYAMATGNANVSVCQQNNSNCGTLYVTINNANNASITFSQSNVFVSSKQEVNIVIYGGSGSYYISSHSNPEAASLRLSGSTLTVLGNTVGGASVSICSSNSNCGTLNISTGPATNTPVTFSNSNPSISIGQNQTITVYGGNGTYYLSSTPANVQASINGNTLNLYGTSAGNATVAVCSTSNTCANVNVVVTSGGTNSPISFSQNNLGITTGQTAIINITGTGGYYLSGGQNTNIVTATMSGNTVTLYGVAPGSVNITICQNNNQCGVINVNVSSNYNSSQPVSFSESNPSLVIDGRMNVTIYGGSGSYYLSSSPTNVEAVVSGNTLTLRGINIGTSPVTVCSASSGCSTLSVTVKASSSSSSNPPPTTNDTTQTTSLLAQLKTLQEQLANLQSKAQENTSTNPPATTSSKYKFINPLNVGYKGKDVTELQKRLKEEGVYSGSITGYYGLQTQSAVKKYQTLHNLTPLGNVGPGTRTSLNSY